MREKSKVDWWLGILIWVPVFTTPVSMIAVPEDERLIGFAVGIPLVLFLLWIYFGTYYEFREDYLYCRSGPFFEKIAYDKIKSIKLCRNFLSSMALSVKRIEIKQHGKGYIMGTTFISPVNREEFMQKLAGRCRNLQL